MAYGAVQRLKSLDWALAQFSRKPLDKLSPPVRAALRIGAFQLLHLSDRVPVYAALNESVGLAGGAGARAFANGVLRALDRGRKSIRWPDENAEPVKALAVRHSHPEWIVERWLDRLGRTDCEALLAVNNVPPPFSVRVNRLKTTPDALRARLDSAGWKTVPSGPDGLRFAEHPALEDIDAFREGHFTVQDEASQLASRVLDPQPGETVADLCAAPGGKSGHLAEIMGGKGRVLAFEPDETRLKELVRNRTRLGTPGLEAIRLDGREAGDRYQGKADRALVDAPCSGLGILRRRPDIRWNKDYRRVLRDLPPVQRALLESAAKTLKPGGVLLYATCTTEPEENAGAVHSFLRAHPEFQVESPAPRLLGKRADALTPEGFIQLWPHRHDTDGFFMARLRKA